MRLNLRFASCKLLVDMRYCGKFARKKLQTEHKICIPPKNIKERKLQTSGGYAILRRICKEEVANRR